MILHVFNRPEAFAREQRFIAAGDTAILIEDGVYTEPVPGLDMVYLEPDVTARGLGGRRTAQRLVGYDGFVALCAAADKVVTWN